MEADGGDLESVDGELPGLATSEPSGRLSRFEELIARVMTRFLPRNRPHEHGDQLLVLVIGWLCAIVLFQVLLSMLLPLSAAAHRYVGILYAANLVFYLAVLEVFRRTENRVLGANLLVITIGTQVLALALVRGGIHAPALVLLITVPILAAILQGMRQGAMWSAVAVLVWLLLLRAEDAGIALEAISMPGDEVLLLVLSLVMTLLISISAVATYVVINARLRMRLVRSARDLAALAGQDALTGVLNRRSFTAAFDRCLKRATRTGNGFALIMIDLDSFKHINDVHGHQAGDEVLVEMAARIQSSLRSTDCVARLGGDEFAVLLDMPVTMAGTENVVRALRAAFARPIERRGAELVASASIGVALYPDHGTGMEALFAGADLAMYEAKRSGAGWAFCAQPG